MPAFNAERTISEAISSVLCQTYRYFELIICDDASSDSTVRIVRSFHDARVKLIEKQKNDGPGPARDLAIMSAHGKWLTFLDADDKYAPERLLTLVKVGRQYPDDLVADQIVDCHDTPNGLIPWRSVWDQNKFEPSGSCVREVSFLRFMQEERLLIQPLVRRDIVLRLGANHGFRSNGEDMTFLLYLFASGMMLRYIPKPMYLYRMTPDSLSTSNSERHRLYREVFVEGRSLFLKNHSALGVIDERIAEIEWLETYQCFLGAIWNSELTVVWRYIRQDYRLLFEFIKRTVARIPFHFHRVFYGGVRRRIGRNNRTVH